MKTIAALYQDYQNLGSQSETLCYEQVSADVHFAFALGLYELWQQARRDTKIKPNKAHFTPEVIGATFLPHMVLFDVLDAGKDFHWRLFGTKHVEEYGIDLTNMHVNDLLDNPAAIKLKKMLVESMETEDAVFYRLNYVNDGEVLRRCCGVFLPLWDEGGDTISHIMSVTDWM